MHRAMPGPRLAEHHQPPLAAKTLREPTAAGGGAAGGRAGGPDAAAGWRTRIVRVLFAAIVLTAAPRAGAAASRHPSACTLHPSSFILSQASSMSWPAVFSDPGRAGLLAFRGTGFYVNPWKLAACWLVMLAWVWTSDWVSRDCYSCRQNYVLWNSVVVFPVIGGLFLVLSPFGIPFIAAFIVLAGTFVVPVLSYIYVRNRAVEPHRRILTRDHLRHVFMGTEAKSPHDKGAPVQLAALGAADERTNTANLLLARQSPGFIWVKDLIADLVKERATAAMFDFGPDNVAVRFEVDGVWHNNEPLESEHSDGMLETIKTLAALNKEERRKRQEGRFGARLDAAKFVCNVVSRGTKTGERVMVQIDEGKLSFASFEDLGMREAMNEKLREIIGGSSGFVLFAARPADGLTTLIDVALEETDRLLRSFVAVDDKAHAEREMINLEVTTYDRAAGETPVTVLPKLIRTYPDVIVVRNLDGETVQLLCAQVQAERLVVGSVRAAHAAEALLRLPAMKVPAETLAPAITAVVYTRLIRKLCPDCKVAYEPAPDLLKKLRIPAERVESFYREPTTEEADKECKTCGGIGYYGRTGMFELLVVDEKVRAVLQKQPKLEFVKKAARAAGMRSVQEEGIRLVTKGVTSLHELMRVLKN